MAPQPPQQPHEPPSHPRRHLQVARSTQRPQGAIVLLLLLALQSGVPTSGAQSSTEPTDATASESSQTISTRNIGTTVSTTVTSTTPDSRRKTTETLQDNPSTTTTDSFRTSTPWMSSTSPYDEAENENYTSETPLPWEESTTERTTFDSSQEPPELSTLPLIPTSFVTFGTTTKEDAIVSSPLTVMSSSFQTSVLASTTGSAYRDISTTDEKRWSKEDYDITGLNVTLEGNKLRISWDPVSSTAEVSYDVEIRCRNRSTCGCGPTIPSDEVIHQQVTEPQWQRDLEGIQWYYAQVRASDTQGNNGSWKKTQDVFIMHSDSLDDFAMEVDISANDTTATAYWKYSCPFIGNIVAFDVKLSPVRLPYKSDTDGTGCRGSFTWQDLTVDTKYAITANATFDNGIQKEVKEVWKDFLTDARVPDTATCDILHPAENNFQVNTSCMDQEAGTYRLAVILVGHDLPSDISGEINVQPEKHAQGLPTFQKYFRGETKYYAIVTKRCSRELSNSKESFSCSRREQYSVTCKDSEDHCTGELSSGTYQYRLRYYTRAGYRDSNNESFHVPESSITIILPILCILIVIMIFLIAYILFKGTFVIRNGHSLEMLVVPPPPAGRSACRPIAIGDIPQVVLSLFADKSFRLNQEFEELNQIAPRKSISIARLKSNITKNRYANILPFDDTRVRLQLLPTDPNSDYINASYVNGYNKPRQFIACQGPKETTVSDFWRMIWELDVHMIVMVTQCYEGNRLKCHKYWPDANSVVGLDLNDICMTVSTLMETAHDPGGYVMRKMELTKHSQRRTVQQMHFMAWPDMGCPESPEQLICFVKAVQDYTPHHNRHTVVHCSAGVGRTGTLIGLDILMSALEDQDHVDIFNTVYCMRAARTNMIQTVKQYALLYKCLLKLYNDMTEASTCNVSTPKPGVGNLRPAGQMRPASSSRAARGAFSGFLLGAARKTFPAARWGFLNRRQI